MDSGELDMFQNPPMTLVPRAGSIEVADIGNAVDIDFSGVFEKFIHQNRTFRRGFDGRSACSAAAPHPNRRSAWRGRRARRKGGRALVAQPARRLDGLGLVCRKPVGRLRKSSACAAWLKTTCGLRQSRCFAEMSDDIDPVLLQAEREVERRLTPNCAIAPQHFSRS